ncbi:hypothetical protein ES319_A09G203300v1 [Gossypium barbadense]|uniref:F-box domain-containing protein n=2 Tax=Gossypium TaxID=3633 RepID=A0A5J5UK49_GOSBA|nr:hypothetical protein ES319_A09G203300v1 [Gossypium barbadense]TYH03535.1 hypothetical protein ES288_A09G226800v1 [Gossypium darwinii]
MGAYFSALFINQGGLSSVSSSSPSLGDLPESCVASIIGYLDPPEICKLGKLNRAFRGASWADFVWESKLPSNYQVLVDKILTFVPENLGKREIYSLLCTTNTLDGGTKKIWLDKSSGGLCMSISSKGLHITGIDDRRYWNHIPTDESRFHSIAYLQQTWWFEVDGEVEFPFPAGSYSVFFRLQLGRSSKRFGHRICNSEHIHGWDKKPVRFQLWTSDGQHARSQCTLNEPGKWFHYHIGDFNVENSNSSTKIKLSMTQIDCTHTKGGLCLDCCHIPKQIQGKITAERVFKVLNPMFLEVDIL